MQINSVGAKSSVNATNFGGKGKKDKEECCSGCQPRNKSMITIPKVVYAAMLAAIVGGPLTSCQNDTPFEPHSKKDADTKIFDPNGGGTNDVNDKDVKTDTTNIKQPIQMQVQKNLIKMYEHLGLNDENCSLTGARSTRGAVNLVEGDIIGIEYLDVDAKEQISMKINEQESSDKELVYDGTSIQTYNGSVAKIRKRYSAVGDTTILKKEVDYGQGKYELLRTYELTSNEDGTVTEKCVKPDGSKYLAYTYKKNDSKSIIQVNNIGTEHLLDNFEITKK